MKNEKLGWGLSFVAAVEKDNIKYNPNHKPHKTVKLVKAKKWGWTKDSLAI